MFSRMTISVVCLKIDSYSMDKVEISHKEICLSPRLAVKKLIVHFHSYASIHLSVIYLIDVSSNLHKIRGYWRIMSGSPAEGVSVPPLRLPSCTDGLSPSLSDLVLGASRVRLLAARLL